MHHRNQQDETLVMLTLAGEETAYEALVTRYQKAVVTAAASVTKNRFMAEDAAQDAFVTAWMKLNTLQEPQKFGAWVCRIAKNCALNMVGRYRSFLPLDVVDNVNAFADADSNPAELYALSEEREAVNKSIEALPEKVKQIIHLHYFEGLAIRGGLLIDVQKIISTDVGNRSTLFHHQKRVLLSADRFGIRYCKAANVLVIADNLSVIIDD